MTIFKKDPVVDPLMEQLKAENASLKLQMVEKAHSSFLTQFASGAVIAKYVENNDYSLALESTVKEQSSQIKNFKESFSKTSSNSGGNFSSEDFGDEISLNFSDSSIKLQQKDLDTLGAKNPKLNKDEVALLYRKLKEENNVR